MGATLKKTLLLMGGDKVENDDDDSDEIIYLSGSEDEDDNEEVDVMQLDSDDERRIDAEINMEFKAKTPPKWDAESVLSTRTNHENHPMEVKVNEIGKKQMIQIEENEVIEMFDDVQKNEEYKENKEENVKETEAGNDFGLFSFGDICANNEDVEVIKDDKQKQIVFEFGSFVDDDVKNGMLDMDYNKDDNVDDIDDDEKGVTAYSNRRGESKEEKRLRKKLKKEMKQQRKREKKANKLAFKEMKKKNIKLGVTQKKSHGDALRL